MWKKMFKEARCNGAGARPVGFSLLNVGVSNDKVFASVDLAITTPFDLGAISRVLFCSAFDPIKQPKKLKNEKGKCIFPRKRKKIRTENDFQWRTIPSFFACLGYVSLLIPTKIFNLWVV